MSDRDIFLAADPPQDVKDLVETYKTMRNVWPRAASSMRIWALCNAHAFGSLTSLRFSGVLIGMLEQYRTNMSQPVVAAFDAFRSWYDGTLEDADSLRFYADSAQSAGVTNREERATGIAVWHCLTAAASDDKTPLRAAATLLSFMLDAALPPDAIGVDEVCAAVGMDPDADLSTPVEAPAP